MKTQPTAAEGARAAATLRSIGAPARPQALQDRQAKQHDKDKCRRWGARWLRSSPSRRRRAGLKASSALKLAWRWTGGDGAGDDNAGGGGNVDRRPTAARRSATAGAGQRDARPHLPVQPWPRHKRYRRSKQADQRPQSRDAETRRRLFRPSAAAIWLQRSREHPHTSGTRGPHQTEKNPPRRRPPFQPRLNSRLTLSEQSAPLAVYAPARCAVARHG